MVNGECIEVKYRKKLDFSYLRGLLNFIEQPIYNAPFGLLITQTESIPMTDQRIVQIPLSTLLLMR